MRHIVELRETEAKLLGFKNYGEVSLATKMADTPQEVIAFLRDLAKRSLPQAKNDMKEVKQFARDTLKIDDPQSWDLPFASEKLRQARYSYSDQEVKQYFTLPNVFNGLFGLVQTLFGIRIVPDMAPVWHPDVQFFRIENDNGEKVAQFYMDLYARPNKRGGAWMDNDRTRNRLYGQLQTPVAYLVCNFAKPVGDRPALLTHDDVLTLFHEFGHGLFPHQNHRPLHGDRPGPGDAGAVPGLHPGLPVLSGGVCVPAGPQPQPGAVRPIRRGVLQRLRLSGGDPVQPLHQRLSPADGAVRPAGALLPAAARESVPAQSAGGQLLPGADGKAPDRPKERPDLCPRAVPSRAASRPGPYRNRYSRSRRCLTSARYIYTSRQATCCPPRPYTPCPGRHSPWS